MATKEAKMPEQQPVRVLDLQGIVDAVEAHYRRKRWSRLKWIVGITLPSVLGVSSQALNYLDIRYINPNPAIERLLTPTGSANSLTFVGKGFGPAPGQVEVFYKRSIGVNSDPYDSAESRSDTVTLAGSLISAWADDAITVETTEVLRDRLLSSVEADSFTGLRPYIRVVTADARRSPVW